MTVRYVDGLLGNDANDGLAAVTGGGHGPKQTINGVEDTPVVAGDTIWVRPGVYREMLTVDVSGGNLYAAGTVSVINSSAIVTGAGTAFLANTFADGQFQVSVIASGGDGVAVLGGNTFTSAAGNFQAGMVGMTIRISTIGAYIILTVAGLNSITVKNPDGTTPVFGGAVGLTYNVGPESPYEIASVDLNTQITLKSPWSGPTLTGLAYQTWRDIKYIGDVAGETWGVGGVVRITGSDTDLVAVRANCITATAKHFRTFRGFTYDTTTAATVTTLTSCTNWVIEDCNFANGNPFVSINGTGTCNTIRRGFLHGAVDNGINFSHTSTVAINVAGLVESCHIINATGSSTGVVATRVGGITVRNCVLEIAGTGVRVFTAVAVGQAVTVNNCIVHHCGTAFRATTIAEFIENFNDLFQNSTNYTNVTAGANSVGYPPLFAMPILHAGLSQASGFKLPWTFGELSQWSQVKALAGFSEAPADIFGLKRPGTSAKNSWGAVQYQNLTYDTITVRTAGGKSLELSDAGRAQVILASTDRPLKVRVYVYREADYAGINPQLIVKQPGQADVIIIDAGGAGVWNVLEASLTPAAYPGFVVIEYVSNNTALAGAYAVYFDDSMISSFYSGGRMDSWVSDVQPTNTPTTSGVSRAFAANGEGR